MMKFSKLVFIGVSCLAFTTTSSIAQLLPDEGIKDINPFLENANRLKNDKIEPEGLVVYSFSKNRNAVNTLVDSGNYLREAASTALRGFIVVDGSEIRDFDHVENSYKDFRQELAAHSARFGQNSIQQNKIKYVSGLEPELSSDFNEVFSTPSGTYISENGWDTTTKILKHNEIGTVVLTVWDFTHSDGGVLMDADAVNQYINGNPGILIIKQDKKDKQRGESILSWANDKHSFTLQINKNIYLAGTQSQVIKLAENIESSTVMFR